MSSSAEVSRGSFGRPCGPPRANWKGVRTKVRGGKKMAMAMGGIGGGGGSHTTAARAVLVPLIFLVMSLSLCHVDAAGRFTFPGGAGGTGMAVENAASATLELTEATFNSTLLNAGAQYALVEFFASWCPACRRFKPEYDRVAKLFNPPSAVYPGQIVVGAVDCAKEAGLCKRFLIKMYPTMYFGPAVALLQGVGPENMKDQPKGFERVDPPRRTSDGIVEWINGKISR
ncbi:hypothetical protein CBR_g58692 [Chara braunii]|uniref:Thioredoxin domain-containing protein n=1 Tax=Chara braunii TaxID=69332 RepID=A0A388MEY1_CHABU|nr:hypothetical protein CBR_g58692 [Chara braunii]|eukprot:GBG93073.1 hypothetical protein CBR_g58692 [Chara braunii]